MIVRINRCLLERSVKKLGIAEQVQAAQVLEESLKTIEVCLNKKIKNHMKPLYLKNRTLHLSVTSTVLASEIRLYQKKIIEALNKKFNKTVVTNLRFMV